MVVSNKTEYQDSLGIEIIGIDSVLSTDIFQKLKSSFLSSRFFPATVFSSSYIAEADSFCWLIARMMYCEDHSGCGRCHGCKVFEQGQCSDFLCISSESSLKLEDTRKLVDHFSLCPSYNSYRVAFIHQADSMSISAMNSVLKILEELPPRCYCLMSACSTARVLPTILSRCITINVNRMLLSDLSYIYPFLTEELLDKITGRIKEILCSNSQRINCTQLEELFVNCAGLTASELWATIHIGLNKVLENLDTRVDILRVQELFSTLETVGKGVKLSPSINSRLISEGCLL